MGRYFNKFNRGQSDFVTAGMQLKYVSDCKPNDTAIIYIDKNDEPHEITWHQLHVQSNRLAWMLKRESIGPGTVVMVAWPNSIEHIIATFAIWKAGACYLPVSDKIACKELFEVSEMINASAAFTECDIPEVALTFNKLMMYDAMKGQPEEMPEDIMSNPNMISMSGGTSGKPKLIRQNMPSGISDEIFKMWFQMSGMDFEQKQLLVGPLFHGAPHTAAFNGLFSGNTLVIPRNLCPENIIKLVKKYRIEYIQIVPILLSRIVKQAGVKKEDFASIKALCHTSGYCSDWLKEKWMDLLSPEKIYEIYSMTEIIGLTCIRGDEWMKHKGSVGLPVGDGKISIRDEKGRPLMPGQLGEIYMKSPCAESFATEYLNRDMKGSDDGFKSVGDFGYVDAQGYLYFVDRRHDMLVTGGENVFATEVETALLMHDDILDVAVVGLPDEEWGRRVHAVIEAMREITEEELRMHLKELLTPYKIPKTFEFVPSLKRVGNNKTDRERILEECVTRGR